MRRWLRIIAWLALILVLAILLLIPHLPALAKSWVESPGFCNMISREVSKSLKLDGQFTGITLSGLTAGTASYEGTGWPGEAIGSLEAHQVSAIFNPWAVLRRVWQIDRIDIAAGRFSLRQPDNALKRQPIKAAPPWYAFLMPSQFYCKWIECPKADVEFEFLGKIGGLRHVHLGATMIGRDFKYFVRDGTVDLPLLPTLGVKSLVMYITHEKADIDGAELVGLNGDPAHIELSGRLGQGHDKSIKAEARMSGVPLTNILPEELRDLLSGRVSGGLSWLTDATGRQTQASGQCDLSGARVKAWKWLEEMARIHNNPDLLVFDFEKASCHFDYRDKRFTATQLDLYARGKAHVQGSAGYDWSDKHGNLDVDLSEIPLEAWLPQELKPRVNAELRGHLTWNGSVKKLEDSEAQGNLILDNAELRNPVRLKKLLGAYSLRVPDFVPFNLARIAFTYEKQLFNATNVQLHSPDIIDIDGSGCWTHENYFQLNLAFRFKQVTAWLPKKLDNHLSGDLSGRIDWYCQNGKMGDGTGSGHLQLDGCQLTNFKFQQGLARFLKDDSYLRLPLQSAAIDWARYDSIFALRRIDLFSPGKFGVRGEVKIDAHDKLSGTVQIGMPGESLRWLPEAETAVFTQEHDGLHWATVTVSGTSKEPKNNLSSQIMGVLARHPVTLIELAFRGLSWWLGDLLGTYDPPAA